MLDFVEVGAEPDSPAEPIALTTPPAGEPRWSLWGEAEA
jgi:hypothetical protein